MDGLQRMAEGLGVQLAAVHQQGEPWCCLSLYLEKKRTLWKGNGIRGVFEKCMGSWEPGVVPAGCQHRSVMLHCMQGLPGLLALAPPVWIA